MSHADGQMLAIAAAVFAAAVLLPLRQRLGRGGAVRLAAALPIVRRHPRPGDGVAALPVDGSWRRESSGRDGRHSRRLFPHWCERCGWWRFGVARPAAQSRASGAAR